MDKNINQTLGTKIQQIRLSKKITQEELADKINISTHFLSDIERGVKYPSVPTLINFMNTLKVSPNELIPQFVQSNDDILSEINQIFYNFTQKEKLYLLKFIKDFKTMFDDIKK